MSAWNYTSGVQNISYGEIDSLEKTLCQAITSKDLGRCTRKDMLFEKRNKGGIEMISMHDLYDINRCRVISQIMENGKRQEGRGQIPWAEKIIMEEITKEEPCMEIYREIKNILLKLGLRIQQNRSYRIWKTQGMVYEQAYEKINEESETISLHNTEIDIMQEGLYIPVHLIEWYARDKGTCKETDLAIKKAVNRIKFIQGIRSGSMKDIYTGIRMKEATIIKLEEILKKEVWEAVIMPELISTKRTWKIEDMISTLKKRIQPGLIMVNLTHSEGLIDKEEEEKIQNLINIAENKKIPVIIFTNEEAGEIGSKESWIKETMCVKQMIGWESPYEHVIVPRLETGNMINSHISTWGRYDIEKISNIINKKACGNINNMYEITATLEDTWRCPVCKTEGIKVNEHFGYCLADRCVGVCIPHSIQDVSRNKARKIENLVVDCRNRKEHSLEVRNYFTDGSGIDVTEEVKQTAWAWVEVEWDTVNKTLKHIQTKGSRSPHLNSVQWCEAKAVLEAIKEIPKNTTAHIHTDSKGTIQGLRTILATPTQKIKTLKHKDILSQIIEEIVEGEKLVIIEWVKGHEILDWEKQNWISKLKLKGNDWADKEAKKATSKEPEVAPEHYDKYSLYAEDTGKKIMWTELPDFCRIWHNKQREIRLESPTNSCFEHGAGAYMKRARRNRTLAFKTLKKVGSKQETWYYYTLKYMMNNVHTRKWIIETGRKQGRAIKMCDTIVLNHECPVCKLQGKEYIQTKEHLWTGECTGTKDLEGKWENVIREKCETLHIGDMIISDIVEKIQVERDLVKKQEYSISNHGHAAALTGL
ncbi:MAG: hypothetical protein GY739_20440 [Mesoflavibacter sp.]|nr:hypothetical protein [Mesoflavibacter sp.]